MRSSAESRKPSGRCQPVRWNLYVLAPVLTVLAFGCGRVTGLTAEPTAPSSPAIFSEEQEKVLIAKAEEMAFYNGEPSPTSVRVVLTTVQALIDIDEMEPGDDPPADTSVYFVQMTGDFVGNLFHVPEGQNPPTGHMLYFVMEADALDLLQWGIGEPTWKLESLGQPVTLDVPVPISPSEEEL